MNPYNPYAPPAHAAPPPGGPVIGEPEPWEIGDVLRAAWDAYKGQWAPLTFGFFTTTLLAMLPGQIPTVLVAAGQIEESSKAYWALDVPLAFLGWLIGEWFGAGITRASLDAVRTRRVSFGQFFDGGGAGLSYVVTSFLRMLAIGIGTLLLIVPGVIVALGSQNAPFYAIDQRRPPIDALRASWESTDGQKGALFVFALAEAGITIAGLLACCLGIFVAAPVMILARAILYMKMSGARGPAA